MQGAGFSLVFACHSRQPANVSELLAKLSSQQFSKAKKAALLSRRQKSSTATAYT